MSFDCSRIQVGWYRLIYSALAKREFDVEHLCASSGLELGKCEVLSGAVISDALNRLWGNASVLSADPAVGLLDIGGCASGLGMLSQVVLSAATPKDALLALARRDQILPSTESLSLSKIEGGYSLKLTIQAGTGDVPEERYDFFAQALLCQLRALTGQPLKLQRYLRPGPEPRESSRWEKAFSCPVRFCAADCSLEFQAEQLVYHLL